MAEKKTTIYNDVKLILENARATAIRAVNFSMVIAYWKVGERIIEEEQKGKKRAQYGEKLIQELSEKLTKDFGRGFTTSNIRYMRLFYLSFPIHHALRDELRKPAINKKDNTTMPANLRIELSWTHYRLLLAVENSDARNYYMNEAADNNWSTRALERQINSFYFERLLSSKNKKAVIDNANKITEKDKYSILDFVKDPYVLEFLKIDSNATLYEQQLETELLNKLQHFLLELGKGFSFVSRQKRITADGDHFYIDLVFCNYVLKCFVLIDLKTAKLTHQDIGQMDFYIRYYEDQIKQKEDNPTIGIILCSEKNETIAKYSVLNESKRIFASKYKLFLPSEKELVKELKTELEWYNKKKMN
jgi:predicted nuclease of restriction endonuclease-like (RecB) superfamily